jgi:pyruvate formate lyase activating enzyme
MEGCVMCDATERRTMTKRQFVRCCLLGVGGLAVGLPRRRSIAGMLSDPILRSPSSDEPGKWSKEVSYYVEIPRGLKCVKCPNECELGANDTGRCRNRVNYGGKLYTIAYGNPCAVHIDPIEKKPLFHFLPSTKAFSIASAGCNLACLNCQNWQISQVSPKDTDNVDLMPPAVVEQCAGARCESIAYTYSEPTTFYEYAYDTAKLARSRGIRNVWKSNGYINEAPLRNLSKVLDAANIDLKSFDDGIYRRLSSGSLAPVLRTLKVIKEEGVWLEITNLVIPGWTDDLDALKKMCDWLYANGLQECPLHFTRFTPLYKLTQLPVTPVGVLEKAREIALKAGMEYVYIGNVPGHQAENTYCHHCGKLVVERRGFVILQNHVEKKRCGFCGTNIPGVWS